jgi:hypothetical protein
MYPRSAAFPGRPDDQVRRKPKVYDTTAERADGQG